MGASPYQNGSYIVAHPWEGADLHRLYCACTSRFHFFLFKLSELKTYSVSDLAYERGYGSPDEIVVADDEKKAN
jgi:hypothetical protein